MKRQTPKRQAVQRLRILYEGGDENEVELEKVSNAGDIKESLFPRMY